MEEKTARNLLVVAVLVLLVLITGLIVVVRCACWRTDPQPRFSWRDVTECPPYWTDTLAGRAGDSLVVPLAGRLRDIPEYHDCQRLTVSGSSEYGALAAVFASSRLTSLLTDQASSSTAGQPRAVAAATILSIDAGYDELGMGRGANCLYLWQADGSWDARMVPVADAGGDCLTPLDLPSTRGTDLEVRPQPIATDAAPAVARWERTEAGGQAIGLRCAANQWCLIGRPGFAMYAGGAPVHATGIDAWLASLPGVPVSWVTLNSFASLPGWRDEQYLGPAGGGSSPSGMWASVIPHPGLGGFVQSHFNTWATSAFVWIPPGAPPDVVESYTAKYNLARGWNAITLCSGSSCVVDETTPPSCPVQSDERTWFARIQPQDKPSRTFCVSRCPRSTTVIGTARWRWVRDDETVWMRCVNGCCEVEP